MSEVPHPSPEETEPNITDVTKARILVGRFEKDKPLDPADAAQVAPRIVAAIERAVQAKLYFETEHREGEFPKLQFIEQTQRIIDAAEPYIPIASDELRELIYSFKTVTNTSAETTETRSVTKDELQVLKNFLERWELAEHQTIGSYGTEIEN